MELTESEVKTLIKAKNLQLASIMSTFAGKSKRLGFCRATFENNMIEIREIGDRLHELMQLQDGFNAAAWVKEQELKDNDWSDFDSFADDDLHHSNIIHGPTKNKAG